MALLQTAAGTLPRRTRWSAFAAPLVIFGAPALFAVLGLLLRYPSYAASVPEASFAGFADGLCRWDCGWYVRMSETGYDPFPVPTMVAGGNWAFFPLMPLLVGAVRTLIGMPTMTVATGVSIALSYATAIVSRPLFAGNLRAYVLFAAYLLSGPFSIYFTTFYTEVLFIFLTVCVLVALQRSNYLAAGGAAALLSATRVVGAFAAIAILVQGFLDHRRDGGTFRGFIPAVLARPELLLALVLAPLGLFAYMAFLHYWIGDGLAFVHVQRAWARVTGNPLVYLWTALSTMPKGSWVPTFAQQLAAAVICGFILTGVMVWRRRYAWALYSFACLLAPLFAGMASTLRFTAALAPVVVTAMELLSARWWLFALALAGFFAADYYVTIGWLSGALSLV